MSQPTSLQIGTETLVADSEKNLFRDRWAPTVAALVIAVHFLVLLVVGGWWYFIAPRLKQALDQSGQVVTSSQIFLIRQSDFIVNYWYIFFIAAPVILVFDFQLVRFIGKEYRLRAAVAVGVVIAMLYLAYPVAASYILSH